MRLTLAIALAIFMMLGFSPPASEAAILIVQAPPDTDDRGVVDTTAFDTFDATTGGTDTPKFQGGVDKRTAWPCPGCLTPGDLFVAGGVGPYHLIDDTLPVFKDFWDTPRGPDDPKGPGHSYDPKGATPLGPPTVALDPDDGLLLGIPDPFVPRATAWPTGGSKTSLKPDGPYVNDPNDGLDDVRTPKPPKLTTNPLLWDGWHKAKPPLAALLL